jgi:type I site-specific restriction-modification system R (restriction) subunit
MYAWEMISKYMVLVESEQKLLVMRPYQIYAVKAIEDCVNKIEATATFGIPQEAVKL